MSKCENCIHYERCDHYHIATDMGKYAYQNIDLSNRDDVEDICDDYKDKSLFVELPCKVGDTVWCIEGYCDDSFDIVERVVMKFTVFKDTIKLMAKIPNKIGWERAYDVKQFGKTVFLTKEQAKAKLKEMGCEYGK